MQFLLVLVPGSLKFNLCGTRECCLSLWCCSWSAHVFTTSYTFNGVSSSCLCCNLCNLFDGAQDSLSSEYSIELSWPSHLNDWLSFRTGVYIASTSGSCHGVNFFSHPSRGSPFFGWAQALWQSLLRRRTIETSVPCSLCEPDIVEEGCSVVDTHTSVFRGT